MLCQGFDDRIELGAESLERWHGPTLRSGGRREAGSVVVKDRSEWTVSRGGVFT